MRQLPPRSPQADRYKKRRRRFAAGRGSFFPWGVENLLPNLAAAFSPSIPNILNWGNESTKLAIGNQLFLFFFLHTSPLRRRPPRSSRTLSDIPTDWKSGPPQNTPLNFLDRPTKSAPRFRAQRRTELPLIVTSRTASLDPRPTVSPVTDSPNQQTKWLKKPSFTTSSALVAPLWRRIHIHGAHSF